jgi:hypothetical protein
MVIITVNSRGLIIAIVSVIYVGLYSHFIATCITPMWLLQ